MKPLTSRPPGSGEARRAHVDIDGFARFAFEHAGATHDVYTAGAGPAVLVMHEVPNLTPECVRVARRIAAAGFAVYVPSVFGVPDAPVTFASAARGMARACLAREFATFALGRSSAAVAWMRALARRAFAERGGAGVGAIGMCLTGNFALAMLVEPCMLAAVLSQPSLPLPLTPRARRDLGVSPREIDAARARIAAGARILAFRFRGDPLCPGERFACLRATFGDGVETRELDPRDADPAGPRIAHGVLTRGFVDAPGSATLAAADRCTAFLRERLSPPDRGTDPGGR